MYYYSGHIIGCIFGLYGKSHNAINYNVLKAYFETETNAIYFMPSLVNATERFELICSRSLSFIYKQFTRFQMEALLESDKKDLTPVAPSLLVSRCSGENHRSV